MATRRGYLVGSVIPAIGLLTGCSAIESVVNDVTPGLEVKGVDSQWTAMGNIAVAARVENTADETKSGTLEATATLDGDTYTSREAVTVPGNSFDDVTVTIDIPISGSLSGEGYSYDASIV